MPPLVRPSPHQSAAFSRTRDAMVCALLGEHPATAAMLVSLGWFPTKKKALKRLRCLVARKRIRLAGTVCRKPGRPEHVYCRCRPKADSLLHEVELTELFLRLDVGKILRGPSSVDHKLRPDAELWINDRHYFVELDRGTMGYAQIERRFRLYEGCTDFVLWTCSTVERREALRARAEIIRHVALFATIAEALASPHGEIWRDFSGDVVALPQEKSKTAEH